MTEPTRDEPALFMAAGLVVLCAVGCVFTAIAGGWWWALFAACVLVGLTALYGVGEALQKVPRDAKGKRLT